MLRYIFLAVYLLAVNIYGFILVRSLRESALERRGTAAKKAKVLLAGALGGALAGYVAMFALRCGTDDALLMLSMPLLIALNVYALFLLLRLISPVLL